MAPVTPLATDSDAEDAISIPDTDVEPMTKTFSRIAAPDGNGAAGGVPPRPVASAAAAVASSLPASGASARMEVAPVDGGGDDEGEGWPGPTHPLLDVQLYK